LTGRDDADTWHAAQESGRFLVTQDLDFPTLDATHPAPTTACFCFASASHRVAL
jgi:predicted nuclease of predicted toxin-antitoxin system